MDSDSESNSLKYLPIDLGESEDLENYGPGGFHPVHLDDVYDNRYRIFHKLGFGGFSTVWLARDALENRWVALKIVAARESPLCEARTITASHPGIVKSQLFAVAGQQFWIDGPNGRHLCLVFPALGPALSSLSKGIYSRINPAFARKVSLQAVKALAQLHSFGLGHGDFTASNMVLRLINEFDSYDESHLLKLFQPPRTVPLRTYVGTPPEPHAPHYIVESLDLCSSTTNVLSSEICIIDFDQSFIITRPRPEPSGIPAMYLAPELAVALPMGPASDVWALGCAIFRIRSGDDLFFDYDTDSPADALRQIAKTVSTLPDEWRQTKFDEEGFAVGDEEDGEPIWSEEMHPLEDRVREIIDEPPSLFINGHGEAVEDTDFEPEAAIFDDYYALRTPYLASFSSMLWKPTAVCIAGIYMDAYSDKTQGILEAFPRIMESEASLLVDLLSKIFTYEPAMRPKAEELVMHPWFHTSSS